MWTILFLIILAICLGLGAWFLFLWAIKSGQFEDPERPKYRMLEEDEDKEKPR